MKKTPVILIVAMAVSAAVSYAAEKSKIQVQMDAARAAVDAMSLKTGENREASAALEQARASLQKAMDVYGKGRQMFGLGDLKPEAEEEVKSYLEITDIAVTTAASRLEKARAAAELAAIDKQLESVKAKIKVFEDRKAELEKLKAEAAKCQTAARELETLKAEKSQLATQIELLMAERGKADKLKSEQAGLASGLEAAKAENVKLSGQIERQLAEIKALTQQLETAKKTEAKPAAPEVKPVPAAPPPPVPEAPAVKEQPAPANEPAGTK